MARFLWHQWIETFEGDEECGTCHVVVTPESLDAFTLPCPTPDCPSGSNPDRGCVMTPSRTYAAACIYCGRAGGRTHVDQEDLPPAEIAADLAADAAAAAGDEVDAQE